MREELKGELKEQVAQFIIEDYEVRGIIIDGLLNAGLDVIVKPIYRPGTMDVQGVETTVFRKGVRR